MPRLPISEQAMRLALTRSTITSSRSQFVCRACIRQYHPSPALHAELPFWKRIQNTLFGSKEKQEATEKREQAHQAHLQELADKGGGEVEQYFDEEGREWQIAAVVDPSINKKYVQAQRWDGLKWMGTKEWIALREDNGETYVGFNPRRRIELNAAEWRRVLHHVAVEALVLANAERDVNAIYTERPVAVKDWIRTARVQIKEVNGTIELQFPKEQDQQLILKSVPNSLVEEILLAAEAARVEAEAAAEAAAEATEDAQVDPTKTKEASKTAEEANEAAEDAEEVLDEAEEITEDVKQIYRAKEVDAEAKRTMVQVKQAVKQSNKILESQWPQGLLIDSTSKMAILKRITQLTGHRLPDPKISSAKSLTDLYQGFKTKPAPAKLKDAKQMKQLKLNLPNVTVHSRRQTPIHKDKEVGRWKVIEEELWNRNLPITGSRWQNAKTTSPKP